MLITVKVKTNSENFAIVLKGGIIHISLTEPAENNRANIELVKEMTKMFGICKIVRGLKSKTKILELPDGSDLESPKGSERGSERKNLNKVIYITA